MGILYDSLYYIWKKTIVAHEQWISSPWDTCIQPKQSYVKGGLSEPLWMFSINMGLFGEPY